GGAGDDRLKIDFPEDIDRSAPTGLLKDVKFVGGPGFDTIELTFDMDRIDIVLNLNRQGFRTGSAEAIEINAMFATYLDGTPDFTLQGTGGTDILNFQTTAYTTGMLRAMTGGGADTVAINGFGRILNVIINTGTGNDTVRLGPIAESTTVNSGAGADTIYTSWLNSERIMAGGGNDTIILDGHNHGVSPDIITGGAGRDRFVTDILQYATSAIITDFRAGQDKIVVTDDDFQPEDLVFVERAADIGNDFSTLYFARQEAELYLRGSLLIDLDGAARVGARDFLFEPE
ncbi:MAG: M10 family metallopeptidase C-terminal domain-containing protein, partial [Gemmobacter sp.]